MSHPGVGKFNPKRVLLLPPTPINKQEGNWAVGAPAAQFPSCLFGEAPQVPRRVTSIGCCTTIRDDSSHLVKRAKYR